MPKSIWKGRTIPYSESFRKIAGFAAARGGDFFTLAAVRDATGVNRETLASFLRTRIPRGELERVGHGRYRQTAMGELATSLPKSFVAEKIWRVLGEAKKPMTLRDIIAALKQTDGEEAEELYAPAAVALHRWRRSNAVRCFGEKKRYSYLRKARTRKRPVCADLNP